MARELKKSVIIGCLAGVFFFLFRGLNASLACRISLLLMASALSLASSLAFRGSVCLLAFGFSGFSVKRCAFSGFYMAVPGRCPWAAMALPLPWAFMDEYGQADQMNSSRQPQATNELVNLDYIDTTCNIGTKISTAKYHMRVRTLKVG